MHRPHRNVRASLVALALLLPGAARAAEPGGAAATAAQGGSSALEQIDRFIAQQKIDKSASGWKTRLPKPPQLAFAADQTYVWNLETSEGALRVRLMPDVAPMHVSSTIYLTRLGFYDDVPFHRIIPQFMAQGGDPLGRGTGGPGYQYAGEFPKKGGALAVKHDKPGLLSMANAGAGTDGSQFFLTFVPTPWLDGKHTIFGEVVEGQGTLQKLEALGTSSGSPKGKPPVIRKATIAVE
jgi:cyclophilin family peptidyl-prolyl cis-trans isomerase